MASITFTDATGTATLTNGQPAPADRFANWSPQPQPIGSSVVIEGTGEIVQFATRMQYGATFDLENIPVATTGGVRLVDVAARLVAHLIGGGVCSLATGDAESNAYASCSLTPGTTPSLRLTDRRGLRYTLSLALINRAAAPLVCHYVA